ncbi:sugar ABC transporter permease [Anoxynatronum sibiricum]|uniref:Xylose transport system permease protein XylH n=1 Tax=Anoxynatronum sibiricum TaxID=210623 RepID=A0ABU9VVC7_9CLOT
MSENIENLSLQKEMSDRKGYKEIMLTSISQNLRQYTMIIALFSIWVIFSLLTNGIFLSSRNLSNLFLQMVTIGFLACGMVLVIVATHIDLSVGSVAGTLGAVAAALMSRHGMNPWLAILITLCCGILVGSWHGYWISYKGIPAFIVTLASMTAFKGLTLAITKGATIGEFPVAFKSIGQGYVPTLFFENAAYNDTSIILGIIFVGAFILIDLKKRNNRTKYGLEVLPMPLQVIRMVALSVTIMVPCVIMSSYRGIPYAILLLIAVVVVLTFVSQHTRFGRYIYAIGGNKEAAKLSGVNIKRINFYIFVLMGLLTAVASIVFTGRLNAATTSAGTLFELDAIAACYIGGTSSTGGVGTIFGAIIGALVMASIDNGMSLMNIPIMYQYMIKGAVLIFAVWVDFSTKKKVA